MSVFREPGYLAHNKARQDHLASLNLPLEGKSVIELGAGAGDHTKFFLDRGCQVTVTDGRSENVKAIRREHPGWDVRLLDVEGSWIDLRGFSWEVVYCYGLLYHCRDYGTVLANIARVKLRPKMLLLETCVTAGASSQRLEEASDPRCALDGNGCRPNRNKLWRNLQRLFPYVYTPLTQPDHEEFVCHWDQPITGEARAVFVASTFMLNNPLLTLKLPLIQSRYAHPV